RLGGGVGGRGGMWGGGSVWVGKKRRGVRRFFRRGPKSFWGGEPIADRERTHARRAARLGHHPAMADDRARAKTATVKEHQHVRGIAAGHDRPFAQHSTEIDRFKPYVVRDRPSRADFVDPLTPFIPSRWARFRRQQGADRID